jgi:hypothetical protein
MSLICFHSNYIDPSVVIIVLIQSTLIDNTTRNNEFEIKLKEMNFSQIKNQSDS